MKSQNPHPDSTAWGDPVAMYERTLKARAEMLELMGRMIEPKALELAQRAITECDALLRILEKDSRHRTP